MTLLVPARSVRPRRDALLRFLAIIGPGIIGMTFFARNWFRIAVSDCSSLEVFFQKRRCAVAEERVS